MSTTSQLLNQLNTTEKDRDSVVKAPFVGYADTINPGTEKINTVTPLQTRELDFAHPFISIRSWIRATPEAGIKPIVVYRSDRFEPVILKYYQENTDTRIEAYSQKTNVYRPLNQGEIEIASSGMAQSYYGDRAVTERRAGVVKDWLNQDELEHGAKAPVHTSQLADHKSGTLANETRFGVIKRNTSPTETKFVKAQGSYGKESLLQLKSYDNKNLLDFREGHVVDDSGTELKHTTTAQPLRSRKLYYNKDGDSLKVEIDQIGNLELALPSTATEGIVVKVPGGGIKVTAEKDIKIDGRSSLRGIFKNDVFLEASGGSRLRMSDGKVAFGNGSSSIELVDLVSQAFDALSTAHAPGGGAPLSTNPKFADLKSKVEQIKGTL